MNQKNVIMVLMLLSLALVVPLAYALTATKPANSGSDTISTLGLGTLAANGINLTTAGGNVSLVSFTTMSLSNHWSAFIGNVSLELTLASTTGVGATKKLFNFTSNGGSALESIASTTTFNPNWANYKAVNKDVVDSALQLGLSAADSAYNMYNNTVFTFGGVSLNTTYLNNNASTASSNWANGLATTASSGIAYTANTGVENYIFLARVNGSKACDTWANGAAGKLIESAGNCTGGTSATISAQFQMIVGVNETNTTTDTETGNRYTFFYINP